MINYNLDQKLSEWNSLFLNWKNLQSQLKSKYKISHGGVFSSLSKRPLTWDLIKQKYFNILLFLTIFIIVIEFNVTSFNFFEAFQSCLLFSLIIAYFLGKSDQSKYDEKIKLISDIDKAFDLTNDLLDSDINVNYDQSNDPDGSGFEKSIEPYIHNMKEFMDEKERRETQSNAITNHLMGQAERSFESASSHLKNTDNLLTGQAEKYFESGSSNLKNANDHLMKIVGKHYKKQKQ